MSDPLEPLRARFRARAAQDLAQLDRLTGGDLSCPELRALAHNLAGAAGTFGYKALSDAALVVDDQIAAGKTPAPETVQLLRERLAQVAAG